jgi:hypothetical protein
MTNDKIRKKKKTNDKIKTHVAVGLWRITYVRSLHQKFRFGLWQNENSLFFSRLLTRALYSHVPGRVRHPAAIT